MPVFTLIMALAVVPAMGTDLYLPALPAIQKLWGLTHGEAELTLSLFYATYSVFLLVHGPLSDQVGRRPVLMAGLGIFVAGSLCSALSQSLATMVAGRVAQGLGAAAASGLSLALAKDFYGGTARQKVMGYVGVAVPLCPMVAPLLGAFFLKYLSWRFIFLAQGALALFPLFGVWRLAESSPGKTGTANPGLGLTGAVSRYWRLVRNTRYLLAAMGFSLMTMPFYAYIGAAPDIYISGFGISPFVFGLFFGLNAIAMMAGAYLCARLANRFRAETLLRRSLWGMGLAAVLLLLSGGTTTARFAGCMFLLSLFLGLNRPLGNFIALEAVEDDIGTASSFLTFWMALFGSAGMTIVALDWLPKPMQIGWMALVCSICPAVIILVLQRLGSSSSAVSKPPTAVPRK